MTGIQDRQPRGRTSAASRVRRLAAAALALLSVLGAVLASAACREDAASPGGVGAALPARLDSGELALSGVLSARRRTAVTAPLVGVLAEVLVRPGEAVEPGQLLARLDAREQRRALRSLLAERAQAPSPELAALLDPRIARARAELARRELRAPLHAAVSAQLARPGARVDAGTALFELIAAEDLELTAVVSGPELARVHRGQRALLLVQGFGAQPFGATVHDVVSSRPDAAGARVILRLDPSPVPLRPGLRARGALAQVTAG